MSTKIYITCPEEEVAVWTGFRAPPETDLAALKQLTLKKCPACGHAHTWDARAAYWVEKASRAPSAWSSFKNIWRRPHHSQP
jgi:hypothetical protein